MKPTFLKYEKPLLTAMILCPTPEECIEKIKLSLAEGAEAFGIQLDILKREYRTKEIISEIFSECRGKPIYVTSYRNGQSTGLSDEECMEMLLLALDCGATLLDVPGDVFDESPYYQITDDTEAIRKQKALIDEIHRRGGEVLMSSHTFKSTSVEENLMIARAHAERGADIIKIVNASESVEEIPKYIEAIQKIKKETGKELLFLVSGEARILRHIGPDFGVCMYLCVESHNEFDWREQPVLKHIKAVRENLKV